MSISPILNCRRSSPGLVSDSWSSTSWASRRSSERTSVCSVPSRASCRLAAVSARAWSPRPRRSTPPAADRRRAPRRRAAGRPAGGPRQLIGDLLLTLLQLGDALRGLLFQQGGPGDQALLHLVPVLLRLGAGLLDDHGGLAEAWCGPRWPHARPSAAASRRGAEAVLDGGRLMCAERSRSSRSSFSVPSACRWPAAACAVLRPAPFSAARSPCSARPRTRRPEPLVAAQHRIEILLWLAAPLVAEEEVAGLDKVKVELGAGPATGHILLSGFAVLGFGDVQRGGQRRPDGALCQECRATGRSGVGMSSPLGVGCSAAGWSARGPGRGSALASGSMDGPLVASGVPEGPVRLWTLLRWDQRLRTGGDLRQRPVQQRAPR